MTDFEEPSANDRWLDQFLGDLAGDTTREEVLEALRGHVLGTVVIEEENPDGTTAAHVQGALVERPVPDRSGGTCPGHPS
jgi:hypothetical protein